MSVTRTSYSVLGVRLSCDSFFNKKRVKRFDHDYPEDYKVDPRDGKDLWYWEKTPVADVHSFSFNSDHAISYVLDSGESYAKFAYIGIVSSTFKKIDSVDGLKARLKELMPDLYSESNFGLWICDYYG